MTENLEESGRITFEGGDKDPYLCKIFAQGENGNKILLSEFEGSWVEAMFRVQDATKALKGVLKNGEN